MNNIAIIPARGGSKRIPRKNIKEFLGKPVISYSIQIALESNLFSEVMVSTDDKEIAEIAIKFGAKVPFLRSHENSNDFATTEDVLLEVLNNYRDNNQFFNHACCLYPTSPLTTMDSLLAGYQLINSSQFDCSFPICSFSNSFWRAFRHSTNNQVKMIWPENENARTQDLPKAHFDVGQFYWFNVQRFIESGKLLTESVGAIIVDDLYAQDIDTETDWKIAEMKYKLINNLL